MSFFSFRRGRGSQAKAGVAAAATESVEVVRKRARQRLIGSAVLVLLGVIGFPLLFDSQPRPVPVDIAIDIPSRSAVKPGAAVPALGPAAAPSSAAPAAQQKTEEKVEQKAEQAPAPAVVPPAAQPVPPQASLQAKEEIVSGKAGPPAVVAPAPAAPVEPSAKTGKAPAARSEAERARELLEGKPSAPAPEGRVVVQVGAYGDPAKAREVRQKLEKAGLKTYTQVIDAKEGKRTRVRVGPFANRAEAEQAAAKIKALDLPASLLTL